MVTSSSIVTLALLISMFLQGGLARSIQTDVIGWSVQDGGPRQADHGEAGSGRSPGLHVVGLETATDVVTAMYFPTDEDFPNPERGWHGSAHRDGFADIRGQGLTLVRQYVRLDEYRHSDLPDLLLRDLTEELRALRDNGLKIILRFSYNFGEEPDAPLRSVLRHIEQLTPVIRDNYDVIAALQAGFIGHWGEWHSSSNDLLGLDSRRSIVTALLEMLPPSRMIQIRYPFYARDLFPEPPDANTAFSGLDLARVGQVNDCFVSNETDGGTYANSADYEYVEDVTTFTVMGGETCPLGGLNPRNSGRNTVVELERFHWDYMGIGYWRPAIDRWESEGYYDEITRRLGYRYVLVHARAQAALAPGELYTIELELYNEGFGKLYNPRPIEILLVPVSGGEPLILHALDDARAVLPVAGENVTVAVSAQIPSGADGGEYDVYIRLPDESQRLRSDPRYSIRFANERVWAEPLGANDLGIRLNLR